MCLVCFLKSQLFHSIIGWLAREAVRSGEMHPEPQLGVDVDYEVVVGLQYLPGIWRRSLMQRMYRHSQWGRGLPNHHPHQLQHLIFIPS